MGGVIRILCVRGALCVAACLVLGMVAGAPDASASVTVDDDTLIELSDTTLVAVSGSEADDFTVDGDDLIITLSIGQTFTVKSTNDEQLDNDQGLFPCTEIAGDITLVIAGPLVITVNPEPSCNTVPSTPGGGGGGGGGGSGLFTAPVAPLVTRTRPGLTREEADALLPTGYPVDSLVRLTDDGDPTTDADSTVYYLGIDGKRHPFINANAFLSWYSDFSQVKFIPRADMANIPLGPLVLIRPGTQFVKIQSDPRTYYVEPDRLRLRWVKDEDAARRLGGEDWNKQVVDVEPTFFTKFTAGDPIDASLLDTSFPDGYLFTTEDSPRVTAPTPAVPACVLATPIVSLLQNGSSGAEVTAVQNLLKCLGFFPADTASNGNFGPATVAAVKAFQASKGIDPAGHIGPATRTALNTYLASASVSASASLASSAFPKETWVTRQGKRWLLTVEALHANSIIPSYIRRTKDPTLINMAIGGTISGFDQWLFTDQH